MTARLTREKVLSEVLTLQARQSSLEERLEYLRSLPNLSEYSFDDVETETDRVSNNLHAARNLLENNEIDFREAEALLPALRERQSALSDALEGAGK